jgi:predicted NBD/HSP70 family sugar kinase
MARTLARRAPRNPRTAGERILADAGSGDPAAAAAVQAATAAFGRGVAALVNALDPELVTISGLAIGLAGQAPATLDRAYHDALMRFRRRDPPPLVASALGGDGILTGAAEVAFDTVLSDHGLRAWTSAPPRPVAR